jgi:glycosyltransferase involved in cell wall biosynthesis
MARIVWVSDAPSRPSGFGMVTRETCTRLRELGHEIRVLGWWPGRAAPACGLDVEPCPTAPAAAASTITRTVKALAPAFLVTLGDVPWLSYLAADDVRKVLLRSGTRWCLYYPVDGTRPDGSLPREWARVLSRVDVPVTMSRFGVAASARSGIRANWIPHGCDTDLFRPPDDRDGAKRRFGYAGRFVVLSDARNHRRKLIPRTLDVLQRLGIPRDRVVLHLHTRAHPAEDAESYRYDVRADIELLRPGVVRGIRDGAGDGDLTLRELADVYAAADVLLLTSFGEGFGLPTLQAASAGVVPVVPANSASRELVGSHGFAVPCDASTTDEFGLVRGFIDRNRAAEVIRKLYESPDLLSARSEASRRFALGLGWDDVAAAWDTLFREALDTRSGAAGAGRSGQPPSTAAPPAPSSTERPSRIRPTGHDAAVLPIPRIGVPTRLEISRDDGLASSRPLILAEGSSSGRLRGLSRLFPGARVLRLDPGAVPEAELWKLVEAATLVVDPRGRLTGLDRECALRGTNFLGRSRLWPRVRGRTLLLQGRLLLTDYPLSESRAAIARRRARAVTGRGPAVARPRAREGPA